jgi:GTP cyclohydrolase-4
MAPAVARLALGRVGITGVRKPLTIHRPEAVHDMAACFSVFVDIPETKKGSDLSRNAEVLAEIVDQTVERPTPSLEAACVAISKELLHRHGYATEAEVISEAEYFRPMGLTEEKISLENFLMVASAWASRTKDGVVVKKSIGAEAVGMTACPCAMETCRAQLEKEYPLLKDPSMQSMPIITHNQRNRTRLSLILPEEIEVEVDDILDVISEAQSSPTYAILKRGDEGQLVLNAHRKPKFVEDVLRSTLTLASEKFSKLPDSVEVSAFTESEESIHKYNVRAEHHVTMGNLRAGRLPQ